MKDRLLRNALRANAVFSFLCALDLWLFTAYIAQLMGGIDPFYLKLLGGGLALFVLQLLFISERKRIDLGQARLITRIDLAWVIGSGLLLLLAHSYFSVAGTLIVAAVAAVVGLCAYLQNKGIAHMALAAPEGRA